MKLRDLRKFSFQLQNFAFKFLYLPSPSQKHKFARNNVNSISLTKTVSVTSYTEKFLETILNFIDFSFFEIFIKNTLYDPPSWLAFRFYAKNSVLIYNSE